jgi:hypothetical protein
MTGPLSGHLTPSGSMTRLGIEPRTYGLKDRSTIRTHADTLGTLGGIHGATRTEADPKTGTSATWTGHFWYHLGPTESHTVSHTAGAA